MGSLKGIGDTIKLLFWSLAGPKFWGIQSRDREKVNDYRTCLAI